MAHPFDICQFYNCFCIYHIFSFGVFIVFCSTDIIETLDSRTPNATTKRSSARINNQDYEPNEVLIKFKTGVSDKKQAEILNRIAGKVKEKILTKLMEN